MITQQKWNQLYQRMLDLKIHEDDLTESFIVGSGKGGQKLQKTASCVQLKHLPLDIIIKCAESRYREQNRYKARMRLCDKIESILLGKKSAKQQAIEKIKRQKKKRSKRAKNKMLDDKARQSKQKDLRKPPINNE